MKLFSKFPSAKEIIKEALSQNINFSLNDLHSNTYKIMKKYRDDYYKFKVYKFINRPSFSSLNKDLRIKIEKELLKPIIIEDIEYSNFMEESSRRISQTFQPISGNLAELCVEKFIIDIGLQNNIHYTVKKNRTDFTFYYPNFSKAKKIHKVEVKNVKLRERGVRGLTFDGDSLIGFFNQPSEFSKDTVTIISKFCKKTGGYCYIPPKMIESLNKKIENKRFKSNEDFAVDMKRFVENGSI